MSGCVSLKMWRRLPDSDTYAVYFEPGYDPCADFRLVVVVVVAVATVVVEVVEVVVVGG